jgi:hypothetical protein
LNVVDAINMVTGKNISQHHSLCIPLFLPTSAYITIDLLKQTACCGVELAMGAANSFATLLKTDLLGDA